jgi:hypothetical protein
VLETIADPALAALLDWYDALRLDRQPSVGDWLKGRLCTLLEGRAVNAGALVDVGALNWTDFKQRMRYILTLFRLRQQDADLFQPPYTEAQRAALFAGHIPPGPLQGGAECWRGRWKTRLLPTSPHAAGRADRPIVAPLFTVIWL